MNIRNLSAPSDIIAVESKSLTSRLRGAHLKDFLFGKLILLTAVLCISIIFLIFIYVGREALPIFYDPLTQKEASLGNLFARQIYGTEDIPLAYVWQPVSEVPKYSVAPLFLGTLKVTIIALLFAAPLASHGKFQKLSGGVYAQHWQCHHKSAVHICPQRDQ